MGMRIGSEGGAATAQAAQSAKSSVSQWQQAKVGASAPASAPAPAPAQPANAQLVASLSQGTNVNTFA